ncbi:E3 ubiquitin ligase RBR [Gracilaria domingensis]|nr:E3 ubiquitin ligase RBR [Gracilaria domingensis]
MGRKRFYDAVRDLIRDEHDPPEQPRSRRRLSISSLLIAPQTCAACWDPVPLEGSVFLCNSCCGALCPPCLTQYARSAVSDRQLLPLRCAEQGCRAPLPLSALNGLLTADQIAKLARFQCELMREPAKGLPPLSSLHVERDSEAALHDLIRDKGWRRCPDCGTGIEKTVGCPHVVCVCGGELCYSCGERWGNCGITCPRRHAIPAHPDALLGLLPGRFEELRDEVWERMVALLERLREHLERDFPARMQNYPTVQHDLPPSIASQRHSQTLTHAPIRTNPGIHMRDESQPVKMSLRSLVHPSLDNRLW